MTVNAVSSISMVDDGSALTVKITTFLPATPKLLQFCCPYQLVPKRRKRGKSAVPHGNVLYFSCTPAEWLPTSSDGLNHEWIIPDASRPAVCDPCYLAIVETTLHWQIAWQTQVYECPPRPSGYTGPFDILDGALFGYSVRALRRANLGANVAVIGRYSDLATAPIACDATTGRLDVATADAFAADGDGLLHSWLDQSGHAYDTLAQNLVDDFWGASGDYYAPYWQRNLVTGLPGFGWGWTCIQPTFPDPNALPGGAYTVFAVAQKGLTGLFSMDVQDWSDVGNPFHRKPPSNWQANANMTSWWSNGVSIPPAPWNGDAARPVESYALDPAPAFGDYVYLEMTCSGTPGEPGVMNAVTSASAVADAHDGLVVPFFAHPDVLQVAILCDGMVGSPYLAGAPGYVSELLVYPTASIDAATRAAIRANMGAFYGLSVAP